MNRDTIYALATPYGISGVAIVRISGEGAGDAYKKFSLKNAPKTKIVPHRTIYSKIHSLDGEVFDEGLFTFFKSPKSFTGEDVLEIGIHGSLAVIEKTLEELGKMPNFRLAEKGEFLRRGLENNKYGLTYIEAVDSLLNSKTDKQRKVSIKNLNEQGQECGLIFEELKNALSILEANIDFADEVDFNSLNLAKQNIVKILKRVDGYLEAGLEEIIEGIRVAIIGSPNSGKSSLLNLIAKKPVAIVSNIAGTTRDLIEVPIQLDGYLVKLIDMAGIRNSANKIEKLGIKKAKQVASKANIKICLYDISAQKQKEITKYEDENAIIVYNKIDKYKKEFKKDCLYISAKTGQGVEELISVLKEKISKKYNKIDNKILFNQRQRKELLVVKNSLSNFLTNYNLNNLRLELMVEEIRIAVSAMGKIMGKMDVDEEILGKIFSNFCIGK
ncbi:MAG: tRNA uridine-5-carboxymethylaminomethyl(34) synthesis GTPase MnmE [Alphaproteobacteria bacterium]|jgi:tRNA modification GTPase